MCGSLYLYFERDLARAALILPIKHNDCAINTTAKQKISVVSVTTLSSAVLKFFGFFLGFEGCDNITPRITFELILRNNVS